MFVKKYRIVNKSKFHRFLLFVFTLFLIVGILIMKTINSYGHNEDKYIIVTINEGDTLWTIAKKVTPSNYDVRKIIHQIQLMNDKDNSIIYPGESLRIPILY